MIKILATLMIMMSLVQCKEPEKPKYKPIEDYTTIAVKDASIDSLCKLIFSSDARLRSRAIARLGQASKKFPDYEKCFDPLIEFIQQYPAGEDFYNAMSILRTEFADTFFKEKERRLILDIATDTTRSHASTSVALMILRKLNDDRAVKHIHSFIKKDEFMDYFPNGILAGAAIHYLSAMQYEPALPKIKEILNYLIENYRNMEEGERELTGYIGLFMEYGEKAKSYMDSLLSSDDDFVRYLAAIKLGKAGERYVTPILMEAIKKSKSNTIRVAAIDVVGRCLKTKEAIPLLQECLNDKTEEHGQCIIHNSAKDALIEIERHYRDGSTGMKIE